MSYAPQDFEPEQEVRSELPPFAVAPHWVTFSVSGNAAKLYNLYAAHGSGDSLSNRVVFPTLDDLAEMMHLSRGDKVTPYMRELEKIGAVLVEKVRSRDGLRWRYRITVKLMPPATYTGPMSTGDWYALHRPQYAEKRAQKGVSAGQPEHPENRVLEHPEKGGLQHPAEGVGSRTNLKKNNLKKNDAPSARSAADGRKASTGSSVRATLSGSAASGKNKPTPISAQERRRITAFVQALPEPLAALTPSRMPRNLATAILEALTDRTPEQLVTYRLLPKWDKHYSSRDQAGELAKPVGVLIRMLHRDAECGDPRCDERTNVDTGLPCTPCEIRAVDKRAARQQEREQQEPRPAASAVPVPEPRQEPAPPHFRSSTSDRPSLLEPPTASASDSTNGYGVNVDLARQAREALRENKHKHLIRR